MRQIIIFLLDIFIKIKVFLLKPVEFFLYKNNTNKISLKFITDYPFKKSAVFNFFRKNKELTKKYEITNNIFADYYILINHPYKSLKYFNPKKTIIFQNEPECSRKKWYKFYNPKPGKYLKVFNTKKHSNLTLWHLNKSINELTKLNPKKEKDISTITSNLYKLEGHKKRIDFIKYIDRKMEIDIYGAKRKKSGTDLESLKNYRGPLKHKDEGLVTYKYHIASENFSEENYFTEKIIDPILSECLCFYWGCPNLEKFIDSKAFIRIDLDNPEKAFKIIKSSIKNDEWAKRITSIREEKEKILNKLHFFKKIEDVVEKNKNAKQN